MGEFFLSFFLSFFLFFRVSDFGELCANGVKQADRSY